MRKIKVIFLKDAPPHGLAGDVKDVAAGFARNVLFPQGIALMPTVGLLKQAEALRKKREEGVLLHHEKMAGYAEKLAGLTLTFTKKANEKGGLFDAVDKHEIADALVKQGFEIEEKYIALERPFDKVGEYTTPINLGEGITSVTIAILIAKEA